MPVKNVVSPIYLTNVLCTSTKKDIINVGTISAYPPDIKAFIEFVLLFPFIIDGKNDKKKSQQSICPAHLLYQH